MTPCRSTALAAFYCFSARPAKMALAVHPFISFSPCSPPIQTLFSTSTFLSTISVICAPVQPSPLAFPSKVFLPHPSTHLVLFYLSPHPYSPYNFFCPFTLSSIQPSFVLISFSRERGCGGGGLALPAWDNSLPRQSPHSGYLKPPVMTRPR